MKKFILFALTVVMWSAIPSAKASDLERRYLAVDQSLHAQLVNARMVMGQVVEGRQLDLVPADMAYRAGYLGSVIKGHDGVYRLYYEIRTSDGYAGAVAYSNDGLNWTLPANNLAPTLIDHPNSNLLNVAGHGAMKDNKWYHNPIVYYDDDAPENERYKMMWIGDRPSGGSGGYIAVSSDGLNFTTVHTPDEPAWKYKADTGHTFFYDNLKSQWVAYGRVRGGGWRHSAGWTSGDRDRRGIPLHSNDTWQGAWTNVGQVVADPMDYYPYSTHPNSIEAYPQGSGPDFYYPAIQIYHGQYIGRPAVFFRDPARVHPRRPDRTTGTFYPVLMHSHDGEHWKFPDLYHPIIDIKPYLRVSDNPDATSRELEVGMVNSTANFIEIDDQLLFYYKVSPNNHYYRSSGPGGTFIGTMRTDGFASIRAEDGQKGEWFTPLVTVPAAARGLVVNAKVRGELRIEVRDAEGIITRFSTDDAVAFTGDNISALMQWHDADFEELAGRKIQLRFIIKDGEIYSFSFADMQ